MCSWPVCVSRKNSGAQVRVTVVLEIVTVVCKAHVLRFADLMMAKSRPAQLVV